MRRIVAILFLLFLMAYLLVPYGTKFLHYGFHNLVLLTAFPFGVLFALLHHREIFSKAELVFLSGGLASLLLSAAIHRAPLAHSRPYILSFLTYAFVRIGMITVSPGKLTHLLTGYLVVAGGLGWLQVYVGPAFYVAQYLIDRQPFYATGFSHHPTIGALLLIWPLSILAGEIVRRPYSRNPLLFRTLALFLGSYGLFLTLSRGAYLSFFLALGLLGVMVVKEKRYSKFALVMGTVLLSLLLSWSLPNNRFASYLESKLINPIRIAGSTVAESISTITGSTVAESISTITESTAAEPTVPKSTVPKSTVRESALVVRLILGKAALKMWLERPLFGMGIQGYLESLPQNLGSSSLERILSRRGPHNSYLAWGVYWGGISFVWVAGLIGLVLWMFVKNPTLGTHTSFFLGSLAVMVDSLSHDFIGDRLFWVALAAAMRTARVIALQCSPELDDKTPCG